MSAFLLFGIVVGLCTADNEVNKLELIMSQAVSDSIRTAYSYVSKRDLCFVVDNAKRKCSQTELSRHFVCRYFDTD